MYQTVLNASLSLWNNKLNNISRAFNNKIIEFRQSSIETDNNLIDLSIETRRMFRGVQK